MNVEEKIQLKALYKILVDENDTKKLPYLQVLGELVDQNTDFVSLKSLLASDNWPRAVDPNLICDKESEVDKISRAEGILELLVEKDLKDKKFLDFGCGEGHVPYKALVQEPTVSVGYDIETNEQWDDFGKSDNLIFTNEYEVVQKHGPYDIILMYDVIDHMTTNQVALTLQQIKDLLEKDGTIYMRTHPFCSRHATHLYHTINKAYIHLVFTRAELEEMKHEFPNNAGVVYPLVHYKTLFDEAGLIISHSNILREKVEQFFIKNPLIKERIRLNFPNSTDPRVKKGGFPEFQCEQQFIDYVLKK